MLIKLSCQDCVELGARRLWYRGYSVNSDHVLIDHRRLKRSLRRAWKEYNKWTRNTLPTSVSSASSVELNQLSWLLTRRRAVLRRLTSAAHISSRIV